MREFALFVALGTGLLVRARSQFATTRSPVKEVGASTEEEKNKVGLGHGLILPEKYVRVVPQKEVCILKFLLDYLEWSKLGIDGVFVNGGYVRDMLLGRVPDDLDVSLCLIGSPEHVTVVWILEDLHRFKQHVGEEATERTYGFNQIKSVEIQGDVTKNKQLDTAKAVFYFSDGSPSVELDIMPTIGEESYDADHHRIPTRDQRGTPKQDALRRDLTIGSMLVHVKYDQGQLTWTLHDFYGGLEDLQQGILRAPFPDAVGSASLHDILVCERDFELAKAVGLDLTNPQHVWWIKVLRDDPLRVLRVFRFAAKLDFNIDPSFWLVIPFALDSLKSKVAGSRKMTEILKLAKYGKAKLLDMFGLCFRKRFAHCVDKSQTCLAPAIFGGQDGEGKVHFLPFVESFNKTWFLPIISQDVPADLSCDELVGSFLAISIFAATFPPYAQWKDEDDSNVEDGHTLMEKCFERACNGLCTSNELRSAGLRLLRPYLAFSKVNQTLETLDPQDAIFGSRLTLFDGFNKHFSNDQGITDLGKLFAKSRIIWEECKVGAQGADHHSFAAIISMLRCGAGESGPEMASFVQGTLEQFKAYPNASVSGKAIVGIPEVLVQLRSSFIVRMNVFIRLIGCEKQFVEVDDLRTFLQKQCRGLLDDLVKEWYEDFEAGLVRAKYAKGKPPSMKKKNNAKKKKAK